MYLWMAAAVSAYFIKGLCGFANTLVFTSVLSFRTSNASISPVDLLLSCPPNIILAWKKREYLEMKIWLPLSVLVLAGSIPGALLLKNVDAGIIKIIFGGIVTVLGADMLLRKTGSKRRELPKAFLVLTGIAGGLMSGLYGVGALLAAYISRVTDNSDSFKANISAVFIVDNTARIVLYSVLGLLTFDTVKTVLMLIPFALIGLYAGMKCSSHMNEKHVLKFTALLLVLSGISLIIKNL